MIEEDRRLTKHLTRELQAIPALVSKLKRAGRTEVTPRRVRDWYDEQVRGGHAEWGEASIDGAIYSAMHAYRLPTPGAVKSWPQAKKRADELRANGEPDRADALQAIAWERLRAARRGRELTAEQEQAHAELEDAYGLRGEL
jgi:hypothetical protein